MLSWGKIPVAQLRIGCSPPILEYKQEMENSVPIEILFSKKKSHPVNAPNPKAKPPGEVTSTPCVHETPF